VYDLKLCLPYWLINPHIHKNCRIPVAQPVMTNLGFLQSCLKHQRWIFASTFVSLGIVYYIVSYGKCSKSYLTSIVNYITMLCSNTSIVTLIIIQAFGVAYFLWHHQLYLYISGATYSFNALYCAIGTQCKISLLFSIDFA